MPDTNPDYKLPPLSRPQRRLLGVLLEKAFTTPDVYPLTIKAAVSGCNQKSNRDPVVEYDEDKAEQVLDELRELGLVAVVHTESGRSARYRHYMRHVLSLSESQLAILTELLLRGRQSVGDLRVRASRMVPIDTLEQLRTELQGLLDAGYVVADAPLDRRGVEVDHNLYPPKENHQPLTPRSVTDDSESNDSPPSNSPAATHHSQPATPHGSTAPPLANNAIAPLIEQIQLLKTENQSLNTRIQELTSRLTTLEQRLQSLESALGN